MKTYNVGIIGCGFIGRVHAFGYHNMHFYYDPPPCQTRITHVCTSRQQTADDAAALLGADHAVTDAAAIIDNPDIDIVNICTPNHLHKDALLAAMAANKHIYCDKPLVVDLAEARAIEAALPDYQGTAQMTLQNRFFPATMRARQMIAAGEIGEILEFRAQYLHSGSSNPEAPLKWKLDAAAGGGVIADLGSHVLDLIHALLGDYEAIMAMTQIAYPKRPSLADPSKRVAVEVEDSVKLLARMTSGATGVLEASKISTGTEDEFRYEIHGSQGALRFNCMTPHWLEYYDRQAAGDPIGGERGWLRIDCGHRFPKPANGFPTPKASLGWMRTHVACLHKFLAAVVAGEPGDPGLEQGIMVQRLMAACRESVAEKKWITVDDVC